MCYLYLYIVPCFYSCVMPHARGMLRAPYSTVTANLGICTLRDFTRISYAAVVGERDLKECKKLKIQCHMSDLVADWAQVSAAYQLRGGTWIAGTRRKISVRSREGYIR